MTLFAWQVEVAHPLAFALLAAVPLWIVFWRRSLVQLSVGRRIVAILLRLLLLLAIAAGLAGPTATGTRDLPVVVAKASPSPPAAPPSRIVVSGPTHVRAGEAFSLEVLVRSESSANANLELTRDSQPVLQEKLTLVAGENRKNIEAMVEGASRVIYEAKVASDPNGPRGEAACAIYV